MSEQEKVAARDLGRRIGFGRLMQLGEELWREDLAETGMAGGEFTSGPCRALMVTCDHWFLDQNGHCRVCCGAGLVTKWVALSATKLREIRDA